MTDYREEMRALILPLDESRRELALAREQCARSPQLRVRALRAVIQAARTVIRASDLGFARLGPLLPYQLDVLRNPENPNRLPMTIRVDKFEFQTKHFCVTGGCNADGTLTVQTAFNLWQEVICPSLQHLGTPLKPGAGSYDITRYKTNDAGQLLGRDGKPLKEVKEHDPKTGALKTYRREGEPAREIDDLDESDLLEYWRCKAADWSDACNVASILFHKELIDTTSQQLSTEPHANHRDDQQTNDESEAAKNVSVDHRDWASATDIRRDYMPAGVVFSHRKLVAFLQAHKTIRTMRPTQKDGTPRINRLLVHLADWVKHRDALMEWYGADQDSIEKVSEQELAQRTAAVRKNKQRRK